MLTVHLQNHSCEHSNGSPSGGWTQRKATFVGTFVYTPMNTRVPLSWKHWWVKLCFPSLSRVRINKQKSMLLPECALHESAVKQRGQENKGLPDIAERNPSP